MFSLSTGALFRRRLSAALFATTVLVAQPGHADPQYGGSVTALVSPEPTFLVSAHNPVAGAAQVSSKIFEGLLRYDIDLQLQPALAESWDVSEDGLSVTFHLRHGVTWSDGEPFTSEDVAFTAMEIWKEMHPRNRVTLSKLDEVETPDEHTAIFRLSAPAPLSTCGDEWWRKPGCAAAYLRRRRHCPQFGRKGSDRHWPIRVQGMEAR